jgi:hypothetical protein
MHLDKVILCLLMVVLPGLAPGQETSSPAPVATATSAKDVGPGESLGNDQIRELIRQAAEKDIENDKKQRDYTYIEREEEHKLDGKGQVKSTESRTHEIMMLYGEQVERLIAKDDKPLSEKDAAKEDQRIQKIVDKHKNESDEDRKKRLEKEEKDRQKGREFVREVTDAYIFRLDGIEEIGGRPTYVIAAEPRPGQVPAQVSLPGMDRQG